MKKNPVARDLRSPKYRKRVVRSKKTYTRKKKPAEKAGSSASVC